MTVLRGCNVFLAVDPGADQGWAVYRGQKLYSCGLGAVWEIPPEWEMVIERPELYQYGDAKPENIITLAIRAGIAIGQAGIAESRVKFVLPKEWKAQTPKHIHHERGRKKLSAEEQETLDKNLAQYAKGTHHNVMDGVCLGLWALGRLKRGG